MWLESSFAHLGTDTGGNILNYEIIIHLKKNLTLVELLNFIIFTRVVQL